NVGITSSLSAPNSNPKRSFTRHVDRRFSETPTPLPPPPLTGSLLPHSSLRATKRQSLKALKQTRFSPFIPIRVDRNLQSRSFWPRRIRSSHVWSANFSTLFLLDASLTASVALSLSLIARRRVRCGADRLCKEKLTRTLTEFSDLQNL